jgi:hypothetical protein
MPTLFPAPLPLPLPSFFRGTVWQYGRAPPALILDRQTV